MATTKTYLDYNGLSKFWGIIVNKFATKTDAVNANSFGVSTDTTDVTVSYTDCADVPTTKTFKIPAATTEAAGAMTAAHVTKLNQLEQNLMTAAPFQGLEIGGKDVTLDSDKHSNIGLRFSNDGTAAYIELYDLNGSGENLASSKINVSDFVKTGQLNNADVIVKDGKAYLQLVWNVVTDGTDSTKETLIDVSDLVDVYTAGEGIELTVSSNIPGVTPDDAPTGVTIALKAATSSTLGGIKIGKADDATSRVYGVILDSDNKAYVTVPWTDTTVAGAAADTDTYVKTTVTSSVNGNDKAYVVAVTSTDALTNAVTKANSALQTVNVDTSEILTKSNSDNAVTIGINAVTAIPTTATDTTVPTTAAVKTYVDVAESDAVATANAYTNTRITALNIDGTYETKTDAAAKLAAAKQYTDDEIAKFVALTDDDINTICGITA